MLDIIIQPMTKFLVKYNSSHSQFHQSSRMFGFLFPKILGDCLLAWLDFHILFYSKKIIFLYIQIRFGYLRNHSSKPYQIDSTCWNSCWNTTQRHRTDVRALFRKLRIFSGILFVFARVFEISSPTSKFYFYYFYLYCIYFSSCQRQCLCFCVVSIFPLSYIFLVF